MKTSPLTAEEIVLIQEVNSVKSFFFSYKSFS